MSQSNLLGRMIVARQGLGPSKSHDHVMIYSGFVLDAGY